MGIHGLAALFATLSNPLLANGLSVCIENPARIDKQTLEAFQREVERIAAGSGRSVVFTDCSPVAVTVTVRDEGPPEEPVALGRTRIQDGRVTPDIEVFAAPVARMIGTRLPSVLGRAMARVAAHEFGHLWSQSKGHTSHGLMRERISPAILLAPRADLFRLPSGD